MPDLNNFAIDLLTTGKLVANPSSVNVGASNTTIVAANANVFDIPILRVQTEVLDDTSHQPTHDYRAGNAIRFAVRVDGFSLADHRELAEQVATWCVRRRMGAG